MQAKEGRMTHIIKSVDYLKTGITPLSYYQALTSITLHFVVSFLVAWALTGQAAVSGAVALLEPVVCHFAHHAHDAVWGNVWRACMRRR